MSHFSILVVGNVDYNMAPFSEFECTGEDNEFVQSIDVTKEKRKDFEEAIKEQKENPDQEYGYKGSTFREYLESYCGYAFAESQFNLDLEDKHKYGYFYPVAGTEDDFIVIKRTNPKSFYDYYRDGYEGLKLKDGTMTNHAFKKDVDFDAIFAERDKEARDVYRKVINALGYVPHIEHTWASLVDKFNPKDGDTPTMTRDEAEKIYDAQQAVNDFKALFDTKKLDRFELGIWASVDEFCMSEDEYVKSQHIHSLTFGYVVNREYHSMGEMGLWAMVFNEKDPSDWDGEYQKFIDSLPDSAELTILDCHV